MKPLPLTGYTLLEILHNGTRSMVFHGQRERDGRPVVVKQIKAEYPTLEQLTRLRQEYQLAQVVESDCILKPYALEPCGNGWAIVLEDFGARSLRDYTRQQPLALRTFFAIAVSLTEALSVIHQQGIIHKDIKPSNILLNPETQQVKLADFSVAIALHQEQQPLVNPTLIQGTLAYMSPEQTGRMNRRIDYRTDFYALGVTFYELLSGRLPFEADNPMELVHCHIAREALPLDVLTQADPAPVPRVLAQIVAKLMAKNAEDRYQSSAGLAFDLQRCQQALDTAEGLGEFEIGRRDREPRLLIPQKLYGREAEVAELMAAFERTTQPQGASEAVFVTGYSGIGKTSIVQEVHKPMVAAQGYFIAGKFDQFTRDIPYAALIQAFQELIRQLLTESEAQVAQWREKLQTALGRNGRVVTDVIPELALMIGSQPEVPVLGAVESQNRFNRVFRQFVQVFCQPSHPLVIFLDDLQWVDRASLRLIDQLLRDEDSHHLLLIGAYRDNEVDAAHPLTQAIAQLEQTPVPLQTITVHPLRAVHVQQLVSDTLVEAGNTAVCADLANLIFNKTQGNPFFITQLLQTLYAEKLLTYDYQLNQWHWQIEAIQAVGIADLSILALMSRNLTKLPLATQTLLRLAACIGNRFSLKVLATVAQCSLQQASQELWAALQVGLILPMSPNYKIPILFGRDELAGLEDVEVDYRFLHDRVQQAAYLGIPETERQQMHLAIGRLLLNTLSEGDRKNAIFALTRQLNFGADLLQTQAEKHELAQLNLWAAQRAKRNTAYVAAGNYLERGLTLLTLEDWQRNYPLTLALHTEQVEIHYFLGEFTQAIDRANATLKQAQSRLDRMPLQDIQIKVYVAQNQLQKAVDLGLAVLKELDVELVQTLPADLDVEALAALPRMTDPVKSAAMQILVDMQAAVFILNTGLALPVVFTMIDLSRRYGNTHLSIYAYGLQGWLLCGPLNDIERGYQFGNLAVHLLDHLGAIELKAKAYANYAAAVLLWNAPLRDTIDWLGQAVQSGLESGDLEFACHAAIFYGEHPLFAGEYLETVHQRQQQQLAIITQCEQNYQLNYARITAQMTAQLLEPTATPTVLKGDWFDAEQMLPVFQEASNINSLFYTVFGQLFVAYLFRDYERAVQYTRAAWDYSAPVLALLVFSEFIFYGALALLAYGAAMQQPIAEILEEVQPYYDRLVNWATHAPMNFQHQVELVAAEMARVSGQPLAAMEAYSRAIADAHAQGFHQNEALAYELAGECYRQWDCPSLSRAYLVDAYYSYMRWGAIAKLRDLENRYPDLLGELQAQPIQDQRSTNRPGQVALQTTTSSSSSSSLLDLPSLMAASQAISQEIVLPQLLQTLLKITLENTGAQKSVLILQRRDAAPDQADAWLIQGISHSDATATTVLQAIPLSQCTAVPLTVVYGVIRLQETVVLDDAYQIGSFTRDPYIQANAVRSALCTPMQFKGQLKGVVYLENNLTAGAFTRDRLDLINLLMTQAAISIENAQLYDQVEGYSQTLEAQVEARTQELATKNQQLEAEIQRRQATEIALQEANQALYRLASLDGLTQVANRRTFDAHLATMWQHCQTHHLPLTLILLDVDYFKDYNDHYGHQAGDRALQAVAQALERVIQQPDALVARYGGEEFAVILLAIDQLEAVAIAQQIQTQIQALKILHAKSLVSDRITSSLGICTIIPALTSVLSQFMARTDAALYQAKAAGRDQFCCTY